MRDILKKLGFTEKETGIWVNGNLGDKKFYFHSIDETAARIWDDVYHKGQDLETKQIIANITKVLK